MLKFFKKSDNWITRVNKKNLYPPPILWYVLIVKYVFGFQYKCFCLLFSLNGLNN